MPILQAATATASPASRPRGVSRVRAARLARDRLEHELDIIAKTGMAAYFLTVADVADRIRHAGIRCAIRGSGAGSFVNHLLGISAIDPLEHDLLMERFLSPVGTRSRTSTWTWSRPAAWTRTGSSSTPTGPSAPPASA